MQRPSRKAVIGTIALGVTAGAIALARHNLRSYITGRAKLVRFTPEQGGLCVTLDNGMVFWTPKDAEQLLRHCTGDRAPLLSYTIDTRAPLIGKLSVGTVAVAI